jgi:energy-coupling factor transporter ATP-binding protein EcfA2
MTEDIEFHSVSFKYEGSQMFALEAVDIRVSRGEIVLITGPAGSGKTTLCSCINGLIPHYHEGELTGEVLVRGYRTRRARIGGLSSLVGLVFQDPESQLVTASVGDEVAFGPENLGVAREEINQRVGAALEATRLQGYEERDPHSLSGGEQQACVIAAIYAMHPEIYVMDEPMANLDPVGREQVLQLVVDVAKRRGKTLIVVEHALEEVLPLVDRVVLLDHGRIIRDGTVKEVMQAGDLPGVFTRPPIVRLAERAGVADGILEPEAFYAALQSRYDLGMLHRDDAGPTPIVSPPTVIEMEGLSYSYDGRNAALDGVDLRVGEGELVAIMGRNGSGKTTLVRHIIGLLQPRSGRVTVLGKDVSSTPTHELAQDVGFCFQNPNHQIVSFTVRDEMAFGLKAHNIDQTEHDQRIREALATVGMLDSLGAEVFDLGKGQKQRLALASVLTLRPRILIIDEPTTGQDPQMALEIFEIIKRLNEAGTTILIITHKVDYAAAYAQRAVVMGYGHVTFDGSFRQLLGDLELMRANSLELPDTTKLAKLLSKHGVPPWLATFDALEKALDQLLEVSRAH